jgi:hypothetical protein
MRFHTAADRESLRLSLHYDDFSRAKKLSFATLAGRTSTTDPFFILGSLRHFVGPAEADQQDCLPAVKPIRLSRTMGTTTAKIRQAGTKEVCNQSP